MSCFIMKQIVRSNLGGKMYVVRIILFPDLIIFCFHFVLKWMRWRFEVFHIIKVVIGWWQTHRFFVLWQKNLFPQFLYKKYSFLKKGISVDRMFLSRTRVFYWNWRRSDEMWRMLDIIVIGWLVLILTCLPCFSWHLLLSRESSSLEIRSFYNTQISNS